MWVYELDWVRPGYGRLAEDCEWDIETSGSINCMVFLDYSQLQTIQLRNNDIAPWSKEICNCPGNLYQNVHLQKAGGAEN